jgi:outer membrane protein TolC
MGRRNGAVAEAHAKIAQKKAELASRMNQVQFQVQEAYEQLLESERILVLYDKTILPAARENVKAGQTAYVTG